MRVFAALTGFVALACTAKDPLVGSTIPPYPDGLHERHGACVGNSATDVCKYSIGFLEGKGNERVMIYAGRFTRRDSEGHVIWLVTDTMAYPPVGPGEYLAASTCRLNGIGNDRIFVVVKNEETEWFRGIVAAYQLNTASGRFESLPQKGIECYNDAWGAE